jgi:CheY-like chemotaxis protein
MPGIPSARLRGEIHMTDAITLLLVEDQPLLLAALQETLEEAGFTVIAARTGSGALEEIATDAGRFRGLVTDIDLGPGPGGWEVARAIRERVPAMPVVYVSGTSSEHWAAQGVPGSIMVPKPFVDAQILTALVTLMNVGDAGPAAHPG